VSIVAPCEEWERSMGGLGCHPGGRGRGGEVAACRLMLQWKSSRYILFVVTYTSSKRIEIYRFTEEPQVLY